MNLVRIEDVTTKADTCSPAKSKGGTFTYIDLSSVDQSTKTITEPKQLATEEAPGRARQIVNEGDVLVATVRPNLNGVARVGSEFHGAIASTGFTVLRSRPSYLDSNYLFQWVRTKSFVSDMVSKATGASYPAVSDRMVRNSTIPLPSLEEQRRIGVLLNRADELRRKRRQALAYLDTLTQSIFHVMFGDPTEAEGQTALSDLLAAIESGRSPVCEDRQALPEEWGVLKLSAVTRQIYDDSHHKALVAVEPDPRHEVGVGDVLFTRKNTPKLVAAVALVRSTRPKLLLPDLIFRLRIADPGALTPEYLHAVLAHPRQRSVVQGLAGGSASSMSNISKSKLMTVRIPVPQLVLQQTFATRVAGVERLKESHRKHLAELDALFASLQHRAFKGEL